MGLPFFYLAVLANQDKEKRFPSTTQAKEVTILLHLYNIAPLFTVVYTPKSVSMFPESLAPMTSH